VIVFDRREAARFRAAVRRCVVGRPRGLAPPIVLQQQPDAVTLSADLGDVTISLRLTRSEGPSTRLVIPWTTLVAFDRPGGGDVTLQASSPGRVHCRWRERDEPKEYDSLTVPNDGQPRELPSRGPMTPVDHSVLAALHACGQTASRANDVRFALTHLQLRGATGTIAGTDGHQLLLWGGFAFPFTDNVLVPAVPVFGGKELVGETDIRLGRTATHVVLAAGPWTVWLTGDTTARFPDVMAVLPRAERQTKLVIDDADAAALLQDLQSGLTATDEVDAVALHLGAHPAMRWPEGSSGRRGPLNLIRSASTGPAITVRLSPNFLARALSLGFRVVRATTGDAPVLFRDEKRSYLIAPHGPAGNPVHSFAEAQQLPERLSLPGPRPAAPSPQSQEVLMNPESNGSASTNPPPTEDVLDPLAEAEALRAALAEAGRRLSRLLASLRNFQKQRRALHSAWTSLRQFRLGPQEES
jgi:hypothetical protein